MFHDVSGLAKGTLVEYRAVPATTTATSAWSRPARVVGQPQPPADAGVDLGPVTQPAAVSVPGSHGSEIGCAADWDPPCDRHPADPGCRPGLEGDVLARRPGSTPSRRPSTARGTRTTAPAASATAPTSRYTTDGGAVTFYYDHRTHWVTNTG